MFRHFQIIGVAGLTVVAAACTSWNPHFVPGRDADAYVAAHPELRRDVAAAIASGEIVPGMSAAEVRATGGEPVARSFFPVTSTEAWLIPASRLRLGHFRFHNAAMLRIVFTHGRVVSVQPIQ